MSEILFGQAYFLKFDAKLWEIMQPYPPLGTMYAASYMRSHGYKVAMFDAMLAESEEEWAQALDRHKPRFAVLFEDNFNYLSKMCLLRMRQAAFTMITMARQRGCTVIVCGADATDHAAEYLGRGANYVLLGEGEATLLELINRLSGRNVVPLESILGLAYLPSNSDGFSMRGHREEADRPVINSRRPDIRDLDGLPFPAWDLIDVPRYKAIWQERHGYFSMNMVTTRGCPFHCNWCAKPIWGQRYNVRSPENVARELKWLKDTYGPDHIWFMDDILGLKPGWLEHFARQVEADKALTPFKCLNRADLLLRAGEVEALRRSGCSMVWIGAESGSQKVLDAMDKGIRVEQIREAAHRLHDAGIRVGFFLQFGYPGETMEDIRKTMQMVRDVRPDDIGISVSYPLPGTRFYESVRLQLGAQHNWIDSSDLAMLYQGPFSTAFYRQLHTVIHKQFRLQKVWERLLDQFVTRSKKTALPENKRPGLLRSLGLLFYYGVTLIPAQLLLFWLVHQPHQGSKVIPVSMGAESASQPSPQPDRTG
jgi:anaerobic magnesium-protoporphyrin IX monomethyl ester cyclase